MFNMNQLKTDISKWLNEDMPYGDITTQYLTGFNHSIDVLLIAKEDGILCGLTVFETVFASIDNNIHCSFNYCDGDIIKKGTTIGILTGNQNSILMGERLALNLLQRLSGIATMSFKYKEAVKDFSVRVVDTRKTTPGLRYLEKYAVRVGGCHNHRFSLSDAAMIKDNHIKMAGSITNAVKSIRMAIPHTTKIEVEVESIEDLKEALEAKADIIMLDNMSIEAMKEAVNLTNKRAILEASGNVTLERLPEIARTGVDVISVGALTHSVKALDISLKFTFKSN